MPWLPGADLPLPDSNAESIIPLHYSKPFFINWFFSLSRHFLLHPSAVQFLEFLHIFKMESMLVVHILLGDRFLYFSMNFSYDGAEIVLVLELQLLMMAAALIRHAFLENLGESIENLCFPSTFLRKKVGKIINHELEIDLIFLIVPLPHSDFTLINLEPHLLNLMIFGLKALLIRFLNVFPFSFKRLHLLRFLDPISLTRITQFDH
jgi:hypothetical protein